MTGALTRGTGLGSSEGTGIPTRGEVKVKNLFQLGGQGSDALHIEQCKEGRVGSWSMIFFCLFLGSCEHQCCIYILYNIIYIYIYICVCLYIYIYIYLYLFFFVFWGDETSGLVLLQHRLSVLAVLPDRGLLR